MTADSIQYDATGYLGNLYVTYATDGSRVQFTKYSGGSGGTSWSSVKARPRIGSKDKR